jgi:hypothetical protein
MGEVRIKLRGVEERNLTPTIAQVWCPLRRRTDLVTIKTRKGLVLIGKTTELGMEFIEGLFLVGVQAGRKVAEGIREQEI